MRYAILLLAFVLFLTGCEEPIDIDLNSAPPALVVECFVTDEGKPLELKLRQTGDYYSPPMAPVANAAVTIGDGENLYTLYYNPADSIYRTNEPVKLAPLKTYTLDIRIDEKHYQAVSRMDSVPPLLNPIYEYKDKDDLFYDKGFYYITIFAQDPPVEDNYYRLKVYKNDTLFDKLGDILITDDDVFDGKLGFIPLDFKFDKGDTARLEILSLTKDQYYFWEAYVRTIRSGGTPFSSVPGNPPCNIKNVDNPKERVVGFFGASAVKSTTVVIE